MIVDLLRYIGLTKMKYNIHNIVKFEVIDKRSYVIKKADSFYNHFTYYRDYGNVKNLDFIINVSDFSPKNDDCQVLDGKYYVKEGYIYCKDAKKLSKWKVEISNLNSSPTTINIYTNVLGSISTLSNFTEFLIHLKMTEKGYPLIHASGVLMENRGIVFASRSGGGKTTIATYLMEKGFKYFGDNFIIINNSQIYNFLSPLNLYKYNLTPLIKKHLSFKKKFSLFIKNFVSLISGGYIKLSTELNLFDIVPEQIAVDGKLDTLLWVIPKSDFSVHIISKKELIDHLIYNQQIEFMHMPFLNYLYAYSYVFPSSKIGNHWKIYEESLKNAIGNNIKIMKIEVPLKYNNSVIDEILKIVNNKQNISTI
jgi:hypothetical protein